MAFLVNNNKPPSTLEFIGARRICSFKCHKVMRQASNTVLKNNLKNYNFKEGFCFSERNYQNIYKQARAEMGQARHNWS